MYYIRDGKKIPAPLKERQSKIVTFVDDPSWKSTRRHRPDDPRTVTQIALHWTNTDSARAAYDVLEKRKISTHFLVDGRTIYQLSDLEDIAYHGGKLNPESIGVEPARSPKVSHLPLYEGRGERVKITQNPGYSARDSLGVRTGDREMLTLDPITEQSTAELVWDLSQIYGIPIALPKKKGSHFFGVLPKEEIAKYRGVISHYHSSPDKWDPMQWDLEIVKRAIQIGKPRGALLELSIIGGGIIISAAIIIAVAVSIAYRTRAAR